ncbi:tRNA(Ile)-lysidine synthase [Lysobacter dokdonensis DS-58]|uniref:tRNA(Ile)-lysidine synthase n=1 Tax=Lysobacter dokdonensis DS-58 TaxID=1300345 RepID=A0A0A2WKL8_9GAMM|nr:tRNA lysidine(34) synthetase TilS [Lysobacter dokdonensis]KGQ20701.1 tRNA(Ile)-lysidine synthase [Lysobacter dokdonensis DS-58]
MTTALPIVLPDAGREAPVFVAFSGGLDSTVLLHALAAMREVRARGLRAIHVHHGLSDHADAWTSHCERMCESLGVPLHIARVVIDKRSKLGLEAAAREARHAALASEMDDGALLALAHHRDDQAETFLLRALRASGPDGLSAMRRLRPFANGWLWRPLLDVPRDTLRAYANDHALHFIDDPANDSLAHDRNYLRHKILPLLRERWPHADAALARSAALSAQAAALLADDDAQALAQARTDDPRVLAIDPLRALPAARRARALRRWIAERALPPLPAEGIAQIERDLATNASDTDFRFEWAGAELRRWRDLWRATTIPAPLPADWSDTWDGRMPLILPDGGTLELIGAPAFDTTLRVRLRQGGERIALPGRTHSHSLKHALQDAGLPPWSRECLPLLVDVDDSVLAAGDRLIAKDFDTWLRARDAGLRWTPSSD